MNYRAALTAANLTLAADPARVFVGYGLTRGRAAGTLRDVPADRIIETTVAENMMTGLAIGLALRGRKPVVYFERMDFLLNALDAIVNHLAALPKISGGVFTPAVIFRCVVGNRDKPLFTGPTHTQDFSPALRALCDFPVYQLRQPADIAPAYEAASLFADRATSSFLVEYKDLI